MKKEVRLNLLFTIYIYFIFLILELIKIYQIIIMENN